MIKFLTNLYPNDASLLSFLNENIQRQRYHKKSHIVQPGQLPMNAWFVKKGIVVIHREIHNRLCVRDIATPGALIWLSGFFTEPVRSEWFLTPLADCELDILHRDAYFKATQFSGSQPLLHQLLQHHRQYQDNIMDMLQLPRIKDRQKRFFDLKPEAANHITNKILGAFLNVSPETLSRLKKKKRVIGGG